MTATTEAASEEDQGQDFPAVAELGGETGQAAASDLKAVRDALATAGVHTAVQRLQDIGKSVRDLPFPVIERLIAPERTLAEFADVQAKPISRLHTWRNQAALLPLLVTWFSLALPVFSRQNLHEWLVSTLPGVALIDSALIAAIGLLTWLAHRRESMAAAENDRVTRQLDAAMMSLAIAVENNTVQSPATAEQWATSVQKVLKDAIRQTSQLAAANRQVVDKAAAAVESTHARSEELISGLAEQSRAAHQALQDGLEQLIERTIKEATTVLRESVAADRSLINDEMAPLVAQFRSSVDDFTTRFSAYQTSTATLAEAVSELNTTTKALGDGAKSTAQVTESIDARLRTLGESQDAFVSKVSDNVQSMQTAASAMQTVSTMLHDRLAADLGQIATKLDASSERMSRVDGNLDETAQALASASAEMKTAATALGAASGARRWWRFGSSRRTGRSS